MRDRHFRKADFKFNPSVGIEASQVRQPSLVDSFYIQEHDSPHDCQKSVCHCDPLYMLFNQERLDRLGPAQVDAWLKQMTASGNNAVIELRKKCSDEDLIALCKSRHIQNPSDFDAWLRMLGKRVDLFNSELAKIVAERQAEQNKQTEVEPLKSE